MSLASRARADLEPDVSLLTDLLSSAADSQSTLAFDIRNQAVLSLLTWSICRGLRSPDATWHWPVEVMNRCLDRVLLAANSSDRRCRRSRRCAVLLHHIDEVGSWAEGACA